ncbi:hypothetical protein [Shewanella donghaensis]|uniref:hypothetical protein n=1 Tax=Shewanella donghaensis TaxID=238836 RepID=UPI0011827D4E|nr:hypothetical protein [Shewanella donghaensis]
MLIVTNYPQVPIATSNVATDLARADNQQAKPILPPQQLSNAHHERALNQKNDQSARYDVIEEKYRQQQKQSTGQESPLQQSNVAKNVLPQLLRIAANNSPTIQRRDIQVKTQSNASSTSSDKATIQSQLLTDNLADQPDEFYEQLGQRVGDYYQQTTTPQPQSNLSALV